LLKKIKNTCDAGDVDDVPDDEDAHDVLRNDAEHDGDNDAHDDSDDYSRDVCQLLRLQTQCSRKIIVMWIIVVFSCLPDFNFIDL
jgi:hypothetical protein